MEEPVGLSSRVFCFLIYNACLAVFPRVPDHHRLAEVLYESI